MCTTFDNHLLRLWRGFMHLIWEPSLGVWGYLPVTQFFRMTLSHNWINLTIHISLFDARVSLTAPQWRIQSLLHGRNLDSTMTYRKLILTSNLDCFFFRLCEKHVLRMTVGTSNSIFVIYNVCVHYEDTYVLWLVCSLHMVSCMYL